MSIVFGCGFISFGVLFCAMSSVSCSLNHALFLAYIGLMKTQICCGDKLRTRILRISMVLLHKCITGATPDAGAWSQVHCCPLISFIKHHLIALALGSNLTGDAWGGGFIYSSPSYLLGILRKDRLSCPKGVVGRGGNRYRELSGGVSSGVG